MDLKADNNIADFAQETVVGAVNTLNGIIESTENKFLRFGQILNGSYSRTKDILSSVSEASSIVASPEILKGIDDLSSVISTIQDIITVNDAEINASSDSIQSIMVQLQEVNSDLANFKYFVKRLRVLGLSTKIESARINDIDNGFDNLAQNVENLSNGVDEKVKQILQRLNALFSVINQINKDSDKLKDNTEEISDTIIKKAVMGTQLLSRKFAVARKNTESIATYSGRISGILSDIVSSLQYQDISRQQIDHVIEAVEGLFDDNVNRNLSQEEIVAEIYHIVKLQKAQLSSTKSQFLNATGTLINEVSNVSEMIGNLGNMIKELVNSTVDGEDTSLQSARDMLKHTIDVLTENASSDSHLIRMIEQVNSMIEELSGFVLEVEDIGDEIELISLNSQIKAVRLGKEGASLGILAENIQKLSVNAKDQTNSLSFKFKRINSVIVAFNDSLTKNAQKVRKLSDDTLRARLNTLFTELGETQNKVWKIIEQANANIEIVKNSQIETDELSEFTRISENEYDSVIDKMDSILSRIDPNEVSHIRSRNSEALKKNYTMDSERDTHNLVNGGGYDSSAIQDSSKQISGDDSDEFGDNVELF